MVESLLGFFEKYQKWMDYVRKTFLICYESSWVFVVLQLMLLALAVVEGDVVVLKLMLLALAEYLLVI